MPQLTRHRTGSKLDQAVVVETWDDPDKDGCHHKYRLSVNAGNNNQEICVLRFQNGPVADPAQVNGVSNESLLAVVIDRLEQFQDGSFKCRENAIALTHLETSLLWLKERTADRLERGVEGSLQK